MKRNASRSRKQGKPSGLVRRVGCYSRALGRQDSAGPEEGQGGQGWEEGFTSQGTATPTKKGNPARNPAPPSPDPTRHPGLRLLWHLALLSPYSRGQMTPSLKYLASGAGGKGYRHGACRRIPTMDYVLGTRYRLSKHRLTKTKDVPVDSLLVRLGRLRRESGFLQ